MKGVDVWLRIDRYRADSEFLAGTDDSQRDFTAVGNEDFLEHLSGGSFDPDGLS
jgi:hypothetical protein